MLSIEEAVKQYTDWLNGTTDYDEDEIKRELSEEDFAELRELKPVMEAVASIAQARKYNGFFEVINEKKEKLYALEKASGFRKTDDKEDEETAQILNDLFDREFPDE